MRCFVAVWPTPDVVDALAAVPRPPVEGLRWSGREQWHVTLRFFGEIEPGAVDLAAAGLSEAVRRLTGPVAAQGGPATRFLGPGLVIWPVGGLGPVAEAVERATTAIGEPVPDRPFYGHLTLGRGRRGADLRRARHILTSLTMSWPVSSLSIVRSELHPDGARYRSLETIPLPPATSAGA
jgi:RNA 2',3'-cyclic 3'-phosphodiesterase